MVRITRQVLDHIKKQKEKTKQMMLVKDLKREVEIGKYGTQKYVIKEGENKGKIIWLSLLLLYWCLLMAQCLRRKRESERTYSESVSYKCYRGMAETEIYMGEKSIKKLILK